MQERYIFREMLSEIKELADQKTTMIIVTHEMAFARDVASQVIFMDDGRILEKGKPQKSSSTQKRNGPGSSCPGLPRDRIAGKGRKSKYEEPTAVSEGGKMSALILCFSFILIRKRSNYQLE